MTLDQLEIGKTALIHGINSEKALALHLLNMGLIPGTEITLTKTAPMGDPLELRLRGYELTLRLEDAAKIQIENIHEPHENKMLPENPERLKKIAHPGVGEEHYKPQRNGRVKAEGEPLSFALIGNQNCGKTTLFNELTGSNQHVGNFPGVTIDQKDGKIKNHPEAVVTDLPGIYSLSPYSSEELVTRDFLLDQRPDGIINILDATNIERNLYLTMQLIQLNIPMVLALNMMDEVRENGGTILINTLEAELGIPVVPISATRNEGIQELVEHALRMARFRERPGRMTFFDRRGSLEDKAMHHCIHALIHSIAIHAQQARIPKRFAAMKLIEGDQLILEALKLDDSEKETIENILHQLENDCKQDRMVILAKLRYKYIDRLCFNAVVKPHISKERLRSQNIDKILTGRFTAFPSFLLIMSLMFYMTFSLLGPILSDWLSLGISTFTNFLSVHLLSYGLNPVVHSLLIDGVFAGVGSVLSFLPIIIVLFFFLSMMEDSGYLARVAFVMDKPLRRIGLSGRSFVPMLIGFGCSVPAIMATRTLSSERDRRMTILLIPFMSCSAKLPIYSFITLAFFPNYAGLIIISLYILGLLAGILYSKIMNKTKYKGQPVPFVMELPNYRFPSPKSVAHLIWDKSKDFITKAFTIIFVASILIWFLQSFDARLNIVTDSADSLLAAFGGFISPVFAPLGLNDWRISTALITGFVAKESVVSTLTVLLGSSSQALPGLFTPFSAFIFLIFTLYYTPCVAAIAAVRREFNSKLAAVLVALSQCVIAWVLAFIVRLIGMLFGLF